MNYLTPTGTETSHLPSHIENIDNPTIEQCAPLGWREIVAVDEPSVGCRIIRYAYNDESATTCRKIVSEEINIAFEQAEAEQTRIEAGRNLWMAQNRFMELCASITQSPVPIKLGFEELESAKAAVKTTTTESDYRDLVEKFTILDSVLQREGGNKWWDTCAYTDGY